MTDKSQKAGMPKFATDSREDHETTKDQNLSAEGCLIRYSSEEKSIYVNLTEFDSDKVLETLEAVSIAIANADPDGNPYGLFWHPDTDEEITLILCRDSLLHQDEVSGLVENMYISCNNPAHIILQTKATVPVQENLAEIVDAHLKPRDRGGYVADYRPKATWTWLCEGAAVTISSSVLASLENAGGRIETTKSG